MAAETSSGSGWFQRYPLVSFFLLAYALGAGVIYLVVQGFLPPGLALASALSASISGVIMTAILDGKAGLKLMLGRLLIWRVGLGYWLVAFLFIVPAVILGSLLNPLFSADPISFSSIQPAFQILPAFVAFFLVAGLGQELGWTGFLIPRLQARYSALTSSLIRAILVVAWHMPLLLYSMSEIPALASFPYAGWIAQKGFLAAVTALTLVFLVPWSVFLSWMFNSTKGSLLLVAVLHASEIWVAYWMLSAGINPNNLDNYWGYGAVLVLAAIAVAALSGIQNLSRDHKRIVHTA